MTKARPRNDMRNRIAHLAARLMAEDGIEDHAIAKRKAARQAGVADSRHLPTNDEIDAALRAYQNLYQNGEHQSRLREFREKALDVMRNLAQFDPHLTGSVLSGTAGKYADIDLQLFTDNAKAVEHHLIDRGTPYRTTQRRIYAGDEPCTLPVFVVDDGGVEIRITVLSKRELRLPLRTSPGGRNMERAKMQVVEALLADGTA